MTDTWDALIAALTRFLSDAITARDQFPIPDAPVRPNYGVDTFAAHLSSLPSAKAAQHAAAKAANENGYLLQEPSDGVQPAPAGRALSADTLVETGVAGLLLSGDPVAVQVLAVELAGYLAGPMIPMWEYAIIDADVALGAPVPVVNGWELMTPTSGELSDLVGVPSAARHVTRRRSFRHDLYGGLAMLRRIDPDDRPTRGLVLFLDVRPAHALWQPLLAMSLYQNPVVHLWARYAVEPGRRVDVLVDNVYTEPWIPDGETELERVRKGDYEVDATNEHRFRRFVEQLAGRIEAATTQEPTKKSREPAERLRRAAEHFLTAGEDAHGEGEIPFSELNADAVLHYVIALEAVLAGGGDDKTELTRKIAQRAAVLAGVDDQGRRAAEKTVRAAYGARSDYAHGSDPRDIDLPGLRRVVRDCILARLILGDPTRDDSTLGQLTDNALLDHALLAGQVRGPIDAFWAAVA